MDVSETLEQHILTSAGHSQTELWLMEIVANDAHQP